MPGGAKRATSANLPLLRLQSSKTNSQCLAKSGPYAGPSAGAEVARLRKWHVWCLRAMVSAGFPGSLHSARVGAPQQTTSTPPIEPLFGIPVAHQVVPATVTKGMMNHLRRDQHDNNNRTATAVNKSCDLVNHPFR